MPSTADWLEVFEARLAALPAAERADIVAEIRAHLFETGENPTAAFGEPEACARRYLPAPRPAPLGRRLALGLAAPLPFLAGAGLVALAVVDVLMPARVGLFAADGRLTGFGLLAEPHGADVLGAWLVPLCGAAGVALVYCGIRAVHRSLGEPPPPAPTARPEVS